MHSPLLRIANPQNLNRLGHFLTPDCKSGETPKLYEWTSAAAVVLKSGYRYTLELSMGNDVVLLKGDNIKATPWTEVTGGSLETD